MRAALAAALIFVFVAVTTKGKSRVEAAVLFAIVAMAIYIPAGYYLESFLYRRRQRKKALGK
ncbi:MAG: hypothetical protein JOY58_18705 [Solirubrobacterales bacterium]|nr:hypothetical protein [Solirubrobacterales bacterium]